MLSILDNNDILRRIRYTFDFGDEQMMEMFALGNYKATRAEISDWLKKEDDPAFQVLEDKMLATFLNGLIVAGRGKREGEEPSAEEVLDNNIIFRKLKIALNLKSEDIVEMFNNIEKQISPHEISAFLRNPKQSQYRDCNDQYLRNFLNALQHHYRD